MWRKSSSPKSATQEIGFGAQQGRHKVAAVTGVQVDGLLAGDALQFVDHQLQWAAVSLGLRRDIITPVGGYQQDAAGRDTSPKVKEQAYRSGIGPLQVVQHQAQRVPA